MMFRVDRVHIAFACNCVTGIKKFCAQGAETTGRVSEGAPNISARGTVQVTHSHTHTHARAYVSRSAGEDVWAHGQLRSPQWHRGWRREAQREAQPLAGADGCAFLQPRRT